MKRDILLTENFRLDEFVKFEDANTLTDSHYRNLIALANRLQILRDIYFHSGIKITSGFRGPQHNQKIGGASGSLHLSGMAADIQIIGVTPYTAYKRIDEIWRGGLGVYDYHVHIDIGDLRRWDKRTIRK